jgi:Ca2+-binding RTX toxin-like protein
MTAAPVSVNREMKMTASFTAFQSTDSFNNREFRILINPSASLSITGAGTIATYTLGTDKLVLQGSGFIGSIGSTWTITQVDGYHNFGSGVFQQVFDVTGFSVAGDAFKTATKAGAPGALLLAGGAGITSIGGTHTSTILEGTSGNDNIHGGRGTDKIVGNGGSDVLYAGTGHDSFEFNSDVFTGTNIATVFGFNVHKDVIELSQIEFNKIQSFGPLAATEFHSGTHVSAHYKALIQYNTKTGGLYYNDHGLHEIAVFHGHPHLVAPEIFVV